MAKFNLKTFNAQAFGKYVDIVPKLKKNELVKSKALQPNSQIKQAFSNQTGVVYATIPMFGRIDGTPLNYDGATDITATSTVTYERGVIVIGRAKAWVENDFAEDVTGGAGFMSNVARQVSEYWDEIDQDTLLAILEGIFSMTGAANLKFVNGHTYDISGVVGGVVNAATLNTAIQQASGDKKSRFTISIMHSAIATNLENLKLLAYMTYTDVSGIERQLELATWNGRAVIIDDGMPTVDVTAVYTITAAINKKDLILQ
ncbi:MAG: phage coat protein [Oscillospiraceae bacterium]